MMDRVEFPTDVDMYQIMRRELLDTWAVQTGTTAPWVKVKSNKYDKDRVSPLYGKFGRQVSMTTLGNGQILVGIVFKDTINFLSKRGIFWFPIEDVEIMEYGVDCGCCPHYQECPDAFRKLSSGCGLSGRIVFDTEENETEDEGTMAKTKKIIVDGNLIEAVIYTDDGRSNKAYVFECFDGVGVGSIVVVDTQYGYKLAEVTKNENVALPKHISELRQVVQVVDFTAFDERCATKRARQEVFEKMEARAEELQQEAIFKALAKEDEQMAALLDTYRGLRK